MLFAFSASAQLINDGATIIVEDGATLFIEGSLQNNLTGSIDIQGTGIVEVEGDITNAGTATITMSNTAKLILSGANASTVTSGGATFTNVEMDKTSNNVTLMDQMRISTDLNFVGDNNKILIGDNNLVFAPSATITSADDNEFIVADGAANTGVVSKELSANEVFKFEVGDATNYTPLNADVTGTGYASATVDVNVVPMAQPNVTTEATDFISRYWNVDQSGVTDYSADLEGTYAAGDLTGIAADTKGAHYGADWTYTAAAAGPSSVTGTVAESGDFTGTNAFGKVGLTFFLQGAYSGGIMTTGLTSVLPLTSPYAGGETVASIPANVVDWIELEIRDASTPSTIISTQSAFLRNDGVVLSLDGVANPLLKNSPSTGFVGINHRNHLSVNTAVALNLGSVGFDTHDFSTSLAQAYDNPAIVNNDAMLDLGGGTFGLFRGDANGNNTINVIDAAITRNGSSPIQTGVYLGIDVNMNATVNVIDAAIVKSTSSPIKSAHVQ
tara:strand:- start:1579 stop:3078 length:1500 start_codon:yes stop_codon:yes gene_type:complete